MSAVTWTASSERYVSVGKVLRSLAPTLGPTPLRILDAGGGEGHDAVALALIGHHVTVLDRSEAALEAARDAAAVAGVEDSLHTLNADLDDLSALAKLTSHRISGAGSFDLALCHDVLPERGTLAQVVSDVAALTSSVRAGGAVSLVAATAVPPTAGLLELDRDLIEGALVAAGCSVATRAEDVAAVLRPRPSDEDDYQGYWHLIGIRDRL